MPAVGYQRAEDRASQILRGAREIFLSEGWDGFSIERIAEFVECSRPLVYKHFPSKEEILLALAIESKQRRVRRAERATTFQGRTREKMLAHGEVEDLLLPRDLPVELFVASTCLRVKTSKKRQDQLKKMDVRAVAVGAGVIREAIAAGDVTLPEGMRPEELLFGMWSIRWGAANLIRSDMPLAQASIHHPAMAIYSALGAMLDGYGWRPLSSELDYKATRKRVHAEIFPPSVVNEILGIDWSGQPRQPHKSF